MRVTGPILSFERKPRTYNKVVLLSPGLGLLLWSVAAPFQDQTISFAEHGAPLSRVMPRLAEATRMPLVVSAALRQEVVCIDVHDVTVKALMARLAEVTAGGWTASKDGNIYLEPSGVVRARRHAEETAFRSQMLAKALRPATPKPAAKPGEDQEDDTALPLPLVSLLRGIGASTLAAIPNDTRIVYSTQPTPTQLSLDPSAFEAFTALAAERNQRIEEEQKQLAAAAQGRDVSDLVQGKLGSTVQKLLLIVTRQDHDGEPVQLQIEFRGYDAKGKTMPVASGILQALEEPPAVEAHEPRLPLSHETTLLLQFEKALMIIRPQVEGFDLRQRNAVNTTRYQMAPTVRAEAMSRAFAPDQFDPLAYGGDFLISLAEAKPCQLVAVLPDTIVYLHHLADDGPPAQDLVLASLRRDCTMSVTNSNEWLCIMPRDSSASERSRVDRASLARVMREAQGDGYLTFDRVLELSTLGFGLDGDSVKLEWGELAGGGFSQVFQEDWPTVELFRSLDDSQRSVLAQSGQLGFRFLTPEQVGLIRRMIYRPEDDAYVALTADNPQAQPPQAGILAQGGPPDDEGDDYRTEPTEIAPNDLPRDGYITLSDASEAVVFADQGGPSATSAFNSMPLRVPSFASRVARTLVPAWAPTTSFKVDHIRVGTRRTLRFQIYVAKDVFRLSGIFGYSFPPGQGTSLDALPKSIKDAVDAAVERLKQRPPPQARDGSSAVPPL